MPLGWFERVGSSLRAVDPCQPCDPLRTESLVTFSHLTLEHPPPTLRSMAQAQHHLIPGSCFPLSWTGHSVTGPAALRTVSQAVLAVHRAVGAILQWLEAAPGAQLVPGAATASATVLPFIRCPAVGARGSGEGDSEHPHGATPRYVPSSE